MVERMDEEEVTLSQVGMVIRDGAGNPVGVAYPIIQGDQSDAALRHDFAKYLVGERNLCASTAYTYEDSLLRLERFSGKKPAELSVDDIRRFMREAAYHPGTKNLALHAIKEFHKWGVIEGHWQRNGIPELRGQRNPINPKRSLERAEVLELLEASQRPTEARVALLGLYAGCRISESARIGEDEWKGTKLRFMGKGRKIREVPVHPELQEHRGLILSRTPSSGTLQHTVRSLAHYTGIDMSSHSLRRTFGVTLSEAGVEREVIGALMGHAPSSTLTKSYVPVRMNEMEQAIAKLSYREGTIQG